MKKLKEKPKPSSSIWLIAAVIVVMGLTVILTNIVWSVACQSNTDYQQFTPGTGLEPPIDPASAWHGLATSGDPLLVMAFVVSILALGASIVIVIGVGELLERVSALEAGMIYDPDTKEYHPLVTMRETIEQEEPQDECSTDGSEPLPEQGAATQSDTTQQEQERED